MRRRIVTLWRLIGSAAEDGTSTIDHLSDILGALESIERLLTEIRDDAVRDRAS